MIVFESFWTVGKACVLSFSCCSLGVVFVYFGGTVMERSSILNKAIASLTSNPFPIALIKSQAFWSESNCDFAEMKRQLNMIVEEHFGAAALA